MGTRRAGGGQLNRVQNWRRLAGENRQARAVRNKTGSRPWERLATGEMMK